jgi:hypothetical protein
LCVHGKENKEVGREMGQVLARTAYNNIPTTLLCASTYKTALSRVPRLPKQPEAIYSSRGKKVLALPWLPLFRSNGRTVQ